MSSIIKNFNLGYFIQQHHVDKALLLIGKQIKENTFTFKTLDLEIYRKEKLLEKFNSVNYYNDYITKDVIYNYRSIFYNYEYNIPKGAYGIRKINFTSFHLIILYYSLGFYFFELLNDTLGRIEIVKKELKNIKTFYGGEIKYENPSNSEIYYQSDYSKFNRGIKIDINNGFKKGKKVCIVKLDIQDFYGSIKTNLLLNVIDKYSLPSTKKKLNYDNTTKESIQSLLLLYNKKDYGLPLSAQNIFSNFISNIFLFELDNYIQTNPIYNEEGFSYSRYVDDFYLIFYRDNAVKNNLIGKEMFELSTSISDFLSNKLDLKINHLKSQKWILKTEDDYKKFLSTEKFMSFSDPLKSTDPKIKKPEERLNEVCEIIESLKANFILSGKTEINNDQDIALKEVFISTIRNYVKSPKAKVKLNSAFKKWDPILTLNSVKALIFLIGNSKTGTSIIKKYLETDMEIKMDKTQYIYLLEKFINLESYDKSLDKTILSLKKTDSLYFSLVQRMIRGKKDVIKKYLPIDDEILADNDSLMQQIKMMVLAEEEKKYNVAFNHLLNVFHLYCYIKDVSKTAKALKYYDQPQIVNFLTRKKASIEEINFVISFFDRRNKNNISHPGDDLMENWVVNKIEYDFYHRNMTQFIKRKM